MMRLFLALSITLFFIFFTAQTSYAKGSYVTIVNPVRVSEYTKNPSESLRAEYDVINEKSLPATWLLTYDALQNESLFEITSHMNDSQELGIFLEVGEDFSNDSEVPYNHSDSWHRAKSLFLNGYSQNDRQKLIDTVFEKFRKRFGYFPKSVGGWWVDSYSLSYMQEKYGITGVLGVSDQYDLDSYSVWGTFWSTPFYPSKFHAATPASDSQ